MTVGYSHRKELKRLSKGNCKLYRKFFFVHDYTVERKCVFLEFPVHSQKFSFLGESV